MKCKARDPLDIKKRKEFLTDYDGNDQHVS